MKNRIISLSKNSCNKANSSKVQLSLRNLVFKPAKVVRGLNRKVRELKYDM